MKVFKARPAEPGHDEKRYKEWLIAAGDVNLVDFHTYDYPTMNTVVIEADGEPVLMNSFHLVLMQEALAPKPDIAPRDEARALRALYEGVRNVANASGIREIWFTCTDPTLEKFILEKGWERVTTPIYRIKIGGENDPLNLPRPTPHKK